MFKFTTFFDCAFLQYLKAISLRRIDIGHFWFIKTDYLELGHFI